jgi:hypothetical protein
MYVVDCSEPKTEPLIEGVGRARPSVSERFHSAP